MASAAVVTAVEARLAANFTRCPVVSLNLLGTAPDDGSPFLTVQYPVANGQQQSIGSPGANVWREDGAFRLILNIRRAQGVTEGMQWADELAALFRGKQFGGMSTWAPTSPVLDDSNDNGNYWVLSFVVPYYADILG